MRNKHIFSESYTKRKNAVLSALHREDAINERQHSSFFSGTTIKIAALVAVLSVLTVSVYAAVQWIEFRIEQNDDEIHIHASLNETVKDTASEAEKPLRSWNPEDGEISIRLNIPDLPSDMRERENTNGKYYSEDSSRGMTINGIDLRRSDLDQIIGSGDEVKQIDAGGKTMFVIGSNSDAAYYNRTAYILFEKEELVLKLWVSYGITDDELNALASTMTIEETTDPLIALPIMNEVSDDSYDWTTPHYAERDPIYETDLLEIGESARENGDWYTTTVNSVEICDDINALNPKYILNNNFVKKFTDDNGNLIPYNRTEIIHTFDDDGKYVSMQFGESVPSIKKLYVITLTMADVTMNDLDEADRDEMLKACIHGYSLNSYSVTDGEIEILSFGSVVVDRKPEVHADNSESIYREYLGDNQWKVAYLVDESIADDPLVLWSYTDKIYVKIQ